MEEEIWKDIPNYENDYQASTLGNIRSLKCGKIKNLKLLQSTNQYPIVNLWKNNKIKSMFVHKIMAITFLGHIPNKFESNVIDHIDRNRLNNRLSNLRLISQRENSIKNLPKSGYHGVCFNSANKKWQVRPKINGMSIHFSYFDCPKLAHYCYLEFTSIIDNANIKHFDRLELRKYIKEMRVSIIDYVKNKYKNELFNLKTQ